MKILIVNRFFAPDESATSRMARSLALSLVECGLEVHVLASRSCHNDPAATLPSSERLGGVAVHRISTTRFGGHGVLGRLWDYISFHLIGSWRLLRLVRPGDLCIVCTDPPLFSVTALLPLALRRAVLINWIMDLFPEVPIALKMMRGSGIAATIALWLRDLSLRRARWNVAPIKAMADLLKQRGIAPERLRVIHHWSEGNVIRPIDRSQSRLRQEWGLKDKFVVGYSGNLGRAHDFTTIVDAAAKLMHHPEIVFLIVGDGPRRGWVEGEARRRDLRNIIFKPLQPRDLLNEALAVADIHLISLLPEMETCIVPSKFYGIAAAGRPTLFVGDLDGEIARVVREGECGGAVRIGDSDGLTELILDLAGTDDLRACMGTNARKLFERSFTESRGVGDWRALLGQTDRSGHAVVRPVPSQTY